MMGETPVSWQTWSNGILGTGSAGVSGDEDWGKLQLGLNEQGRSQVYYLGISTPRVFSLEENRYENGLCRATAQIRGSNTPFNQNDASPSWITYTGPLNATWLYVQVRVIKLS